MIKVATDAGGTFTDLVAFEEASGKIYVGKALTTPKDPSQGVIDSIVQGRETGLVTDDISFFVHGGTTVINAITERKGVRTAIVTTEGFRDVIAIGRGNRPDLYNLHSRTLEPFAPSTCVSKSSSGSTPGAMCGRRCRCPRSTPSPKPWWLLASKRSRSYSCTPTSTRRTRR
jgi:N-methylhydantoinase A/oxoprolinase/acetone carboxylase beta subunit